MSELKENILFRGDLTRPLTTPEMDRNFKMVSNPFSKNRLYNPGNIVYHNIIIEDKEYFCWFRAKKQIPKGLEFNQDDWDVIGVDFERIENIEKDIDSIKNSVSPTKDTKDGSDIYIDKEKLKVKLINKPENNVKLNNDNGISAEFDWKDWDGKDNIVVNLVKKDFSDINSAKNKSKEQGLIVVDTKSNNIFINNRLIGSNVRDITVEPFEDEELPSILKIWKAGNNNVDYPDYTLDFHDMASASEIEKVFNTMTVNSIKFKPVASDGHINAEILGENIKLAKSYLSPTYIETEIDTIDQKVESNQINAKDDISIAIHKLDEKISNAMDFTAIKIKPVNIKGENDKDFNNTDLVNVRVTKKDNDISLRTSIKTQTLEKTNDGYVNVKAGTKLDPNIQYYSYNLSEFKFEPYDTKEFGLKSNGNCFTFNDKSINEGVVKSSDIKRSLERLLNKTYWVKFE